MKRVKKTFRFGLQMESDSCVQYTLYDSPLRYARLPIINCYSLYFYTELFLVMITLTFCASSAFLEPNGRKNGAAIVMRAPALGRKNGKSVE